MTSIVHAIREARSRVALTERLPEMEVVPNTELDFFVLLIALANTYTEGPSSSLTQTTPTSLFPLSRPPVSPVT